MDNKLQVSVILPLKSSKSKDFLDYFDKAIKSLQNQKTQIDELIIVHNQEEYLIEFLNQFDFGDLKVNKFVFQTLRVSVQTDLLLSSITKVIGKS